MNRHAVGLLEVRPDDRVLEIGFGPGKQIQLPARRATAGLVAGVDLSEVMVEQATKPKHLPTARRCFASLSMTDPVTSTVALH